MHGLRIIILFLIFAAAQAPGAFAADDFISGKKVVIDSLPTNLATFGFTVANHPNERLNLRHTARSEKSLVLPGRSLAADFDTTINVLVLRFNFVEEVEDNPYTTGSGIMNLKRPLLNPVDSAAYFDSAGHWVDPPPHDSLYFDAHMKALNRYWETVSGNRLSLTWDIFPPGRDSVYQLPHEMGYYGFCSLDSIVLGLQRFFIDCIHRADSAHIYNPQHPDIDFNNYQAIILFHAGSDRQNDIGFPLTCADLFTGYIRFLDTSIVVDNGAGLVNSALMMPETSSQDNRATALNAVMAHEFGHQLGLVDLYSTYAFPFISCLGDFALMDYNGFNIGLEVPAYFSSPRVGAVFGAMPIFPCAWSRAYLGFDEVYDYRQGSDIRLVAAEVASAGIKIARVPISEHEYYLIENRLDDIDGNDTIFIKQDTITGVFLWPKNRYVDFNREYDALIPGSGMVIYHVDEAVAWLYYRDSSFTYNNFELNDLQWDRSRRFIKLVEADGIEDFHGYYPGGYGKEEDMFREDRNHAFTPNTNPPAIDNSGNNTHIYIENISRLDTIYPGETQPTIVDSIMRFDLETRDMAAAFPVRVGPYGLAAVVDDLNHDGQKEIIVAAGDLLSVFTSRGENFLRQLHPFDDSLVYYDSTLAIINPGERYRPEGVEVTLHTWPQPVPLYDRTLSIIYAGPVTGQFDTTVLQNKMIAVGLKTTATNGLLSFYTTNDFDGDGRADRTNAIGAEIITQGIPIALSFGSKLYALTSSGRVYFKDALTAIPLIYNFPNEEYHGICRLSPDRLLLIAGDSPAGGSEKTRIYYMGGTLAAVDSMVLDGYYNLGPVLVDINRDSLPEVAICSPDGEIVLVTVDTTSQLPSFGILARRDTGYRFTVNPVVGDVDRNGAADLILGGVNAIYAFNRELTIKTGFPRKINDRFPYDTVTAPSIMADIRHGDFPEIIFPTGVGNIYSFGQDKTYGFPLSAGELGAGSCVYWVESEGELTHGYLGYIGADGWFYAWSMDPDTVHNYWPMIGHDARGTYAFDNRQLRAPSSLAGKFPKERFYNYPNPVTSGRTTITYWLNEEARKVSMAIYDLSGREVQTFGGLTTSSGEENEITWNCGSVTPGIYRCIINVEFSGATETAFTDIAVIR
ncbi:MAG: T9SS type A sorting domain-containing protein [candidate division Zixibacteria bacterium]|nr:T9SS type A sorting domain-containing protein [candidate division Zixibacteria bacterium]